MLVYGDRIRVCDPRHLLARLGDMLDEISAEPAALARHARLVSVFIEAGQLAQGLADAERALRGCDARSRSNDAAMQLLMALAHVIGRSWRNETIELVAARNALTTVTLCRCPEEIDTKRPEGYAFYAVYPEAYLLAAERAATPPRHVIGVRSIGTSLAAAVAAGARANLPATVRPTGEPFRRSIVVAPALIAEWTATPVGTIAVVDEGPGLSGSSLGSMLDVLEDHGVPLDRLACYPSHGGDLGPAASPRHRERWHRITRHVIDVDSLIADRLPVWLRELIGPLDQPIVEISAGEWRRRRYSNQRDWPAAVVHQERRKFLAHTAAGTWLARFAGIGSECEGVLSRARAMHAAGFTPQVAGACHGFLVERWHDELAPAGRVDLEQLGRYLGFRARLAAPFGGASMRELWHMAHHNIAAALGDDAAIPLDRWSPRLDELSARVRPCAIDGRLHAWEWLDDGRGNVLKADAHDHHAAHDLIGCQDIAWDLAGAATELGLDPDSLGLLTRVVAIHAGVDPDPELVAFARICYPAFQLGRSALAIATSTREEARRLTSEVTRYTGVLRRAL
ncbi:MAG: hypothetical protein AB7P03_16550 [Kofleriaceae bacterium]